MMRSSSKRPSESGYLALAPFRSAVRRARNPGVLVATVLSGALVVNGCSDTFEVDQEPGALGGMGGQATGGAEDVASGGQDPDGVGGTGGGDDLVSSGGQDSPGPSGGQGGEGPEVPLVCDDPEVLCGDACVDPTTDDAFCGADCEQGDLGDVCGEEEECVDGQCILQCPEGTLDCFGTCVDPLSDDLYCGASDACLSDDEQGDYCGTAESCVAGACVGWGDIHEEPEGTSPFATAIRQDGTVLWAMRLENAWSFRVLVPSETEFGAWGPTIQPGPQYLDAEFSHEGIAAVGADTEWGVELGLFDVDTMSTYTAPGYYDNVIQRQLVVDHGNDRFYMVGDDNTSVFENQLVARGLTVNDKLFDDSGLLFPIAEKADTPASTAAVRGLFASTWRVSSVDEGGQVESQLVRMRFVNPDVTCCDSRVISSNELFAASTPQLAMDLDQNVVAVWAESAGATWHLRSWTVKSAETPLEDWKGTRELMASSVSRDEPDFVLRGESGGDRILVWTQETAGETSLAHRFYDSETDTWSEVDFVDDAAPQLSDRSSEQHLMDVAMNDAGFANVAWVGQDGSIWSTSRKPGAAAFGKVHLVASVTGVQRLQTQIDERGRVFVFWESDTGALFARWME